ncbi:MAG: flagellar biosynthesis protein FliQ [Armatimonadetes bacterium]|nr:flagellar biosynthesis protein FliQ [Armatimonadota bacterium]
MTVEFVIGLAREALVVSLLLSAPTLGLGLIVGVLVSVFQAVTSIQEQTLTFIPKILAGAVALVFFGPWMLIIMLNFTSRILGNLGNFAR